MGNAGSQRPQTFDNSVVHESDYLQTYRGGNSNGKIPMGAGQPGMSIGAKIIKSTTALKDRHGIVQPAGEWYVETKEGSRLFLSSGGQFIPQAKQYIKNAKGYGEGPAIMIAGTASQPKYTVFSSTSTAPGSNYSPMTVTNLADLKKAIKYGHENEPAGPYSNMYGSAAVDPFLDRPRNSFSDLADFGRGALQVVDLVAEPLLEYGIDAITDSNLGSVLMQVTGLSNKIQEGLDSLTDIKGIEFNSTTGAGDGLSNIIGDPRVDEELSRIEEGSRKRVSDYPGNSYSSKLSNILNQRTSNKHDRVLRLRKLKAMNLGVDGENQMNILKKTVSIMKKLVPNPPDLSWDSIERNIQNVSTPEDMVKMAQLTTRNLVSKVLPIVKQKTAQTQQAASVPSKTAPEVDSKPQKVPVGHESTTINGHPQAQPLKQAIHPFVPPPPPMVF